MSISEICIVDDEPDLGKICEDHLRTQYKVRTFISAEAALRAFNDEDYEPSLVLTDIKMPGIDGLEMLSQIKSGGKQVPSIIMSAYADKNYALRAIEEGVAAFIEKPFSLDQLENLVAKVMEQHKRLQKVEDILAKQEQLSRAHNELIRKYVHRFTVAENFIYESGLTFPATPKETKEFLRHVRDENALEALIEGVSAEVERALKEYRFPIP